VEFRVAPGTDAVAYRFTLNTLIVPDSTIVSVAFDTDRNTGTGSATLPRDPGAPFPGTDQVLTTWGSGAELSRWDAAGQRWQTTSVPVHADLEANQLTVTVPRAVSDPRGVWRTTVATGLFDRASRGWVVPQGQPSGIFNVGPRFDEPVSHADVSQNFADGIGAPAPDQSQAAALANDDPTAFAHNVDFGLLDRRVTEVHVPATGSQVRLFPSRLVFHEGIGDAPTLAGQLQPYFVYIPSSAKQGHRPGLTLALHSLGDQYWQYANTLGIQEWGEQRDSIIASPEARATDGWFRDEAEYDVFEMWNDLARHVAIDSDRTAILGYSMGGLGTYRLGLSYPDLFGRALTMVGGGGGEGIWIPPGPPTSAARGSRPADPGWQWCACLWLENARNLPYFNQIAGEDEFTNNGAYATNLGFPGFNSFRQLGYRFQLRLYPTAEHLTLGGLSYDMPGATAFLGNGAVDRNPPHVSFAYVPATDNTKLGLVRDHAYWISQVKLANPNGDPSLVPEPGGSLTYHIGDPQVVGKGVVDAFSHGFGTGDATSVQQTNDAGTGPLPLAWTQVGQTWGPLARVAMANQLDLNVANVSSFHVDLARARVNRGRSVVLNVTTNGPTRIYLDGTDGTASRFVDVTAGTHRLAVDIG